MCDPIAAVTAIRPNGKPYTRRVRPEVLAEFDMDADPWVDYMAVVLRTHDVDEAVALIWAFEGWEDNRQRQDLVPAPQLRWVRQSRCMCGGGHASDLVDDDVRGVPAVEFYRRASSHV